MKAKQNSKAGSIYLLGIGFFLFVMGAVFCWLMAKSFGNASDTRKWVKTPCLIIRSEVAKRADSNIAPEYRWQVFYKYQFAGGDYTSDLYKPIDQARGQRWGKSVEKVKKLIEQYPKDTKAVCFVNPDALQMTILDVWWLEPMLSVQTSLFTPSLKKSSNLLLTSFAI